MHQCAYLFQLIKSRGFLKVSLVVQFDNLCFVIYNIITISVNYIKRGNASIVSFWFIEPPSFLFLFLFLFIFIYFLFFKF